MLVKTFKEIKEVSHLQVSQIPLNGFIRIDPGEIMED